MDSEHCATRHWLCHGFSTMGNWYSEKAQRFFQIDKGLGSADRQSPRRSCQHVRRIHLFVTRDAERGLFTALNDLIVVRSFFLICVYRCLSFSRVAVSFSHIVKACEPAFGAMGSAVVLGEVYSPGVYLSLLPIIAGVSLSAVTQFQFSWAGFLFAMLSNLAFASRNIFSKLTMGDFKKDETLTPANIYGIMSIMAFLIELPIALAIEGFAPLPSSRIAKLLLGSGVFYTLYNTVSFMALGRTGVVTHAVGNILKRASVIIVSILVFGTPVRLLNGIGMAIALLGTCLYSLMKSRFQARKAAAAKAA